MIDWRLVVGIGLAALAFAPTGAAASSVSQQSRLDTAKATGSNFVIDDFSSFNIQVDAFSGPAGVNPGGQVSFEAGVVRLPISGPVTCLEVTGNTAVIRVEGPFPAAPGWLAVIVRLVDNGGSGLDRFEFYPVLPEIDFPIDCRTGAPAYFGGLLDGRALVTEAAGQCHLGTFASCPDADPPETTITESPPRITYRSTVKFRFRSDEPGAAFECKLDNSGFGACTSPTRFKGLNPGRHRFAVRSTDAAGNVDPSPAGRRFWVLG